MQTTDCIDNTNTDSSILYLLLTFKFHFDIPIIQRVVAIIEADGTRWTQFSDGETIAGLTAARSGFSRLALTFTTDGTRWIGTNDDGTVRGYTAAIPRLSQGERVFITFFLCF